MRNSIAFCLMLLSFFSCKKDKKPVIDISDELRQYFNYQPGTYWVYYDSVSGVTDSLWVANTFLINHAESDRDVTGHGIEILTSKVFDTPYNKYKTIETIELRENLIYYAFNFSNEPSNPAFILTTPFTANVAAISINNRIFNDVIALPHFSTTALKDSLFVNKSVGAIKIKTNSGSKNYNLLRWNIVTHR